MLKQNALLFYARSCALIYRHELRMWNAILVSCVSVPQTYTPILDIGTWDLSHRSMAVPYPLHTSFPSNFTDLPMPTSYPFNVTDPITTPVQQNMPYPYQQRPYAADLTSHSIQQHLDSRMPLPQQPIIGQEMVSYCIFYCFITKISIIFM